MLQALTDPDRDVNIVIDIPLKGKVAKKVRNSTTVGELLKKVRLDGRNSAIKVFFGEINLTLQMISEC